MKRRLLIKCGIALLVLPTCIWLLRDRTPKYNGKSIHQWSNGLKDQSLKYADAWNALIDHGTNVVPELLLELQADETKWQKIKIACWGILPGIIQKKIPSPPNLIFSTHEVFVVNFVHRVEPSSTEIILKFLHNTRPEVRATCAWILGDSRMVSLEIVPELIKALRDPAAMVRMRAADSLGARGSNAAPAISTLVEIVRNDPDNGNNGPYVRDAALRALGKIGPPAREAIPVLKKTMESGNTRWTVFAAIALFRIERDSSIAFPSLTNQYTTWSDWEKWTILQTWDEMGTNAHAAVPLICDYARKITYNSATAMYPGTEIRRESLDALEKIDPAAAKKLKKEFTSFP